MKVIYIAGKYRGPNAWDIEQNIRAAEDVAARVLAAGMMPLCTHSMTRHMDGIASEAFMLAGTLELMRRCDAVVLVPNWRDSEGARAEVAEAMRLGLPIMYAWGDASYFHDIMVRFCEVEKSMVVYPHDTLECDESWTWGVS